MANTYSLATRRQVFLERLKAGEAKKFVAVLREMDATLRERLTASGLTDYQRARVERLLADVGSRLSAILGDWRKSHTEQLQEIGTVEAEWEAKALGQATRDYEPVIPTTEQIRAAIELTPMSVQGAGGGQLLTTFLEGWTDKQVSDLTGVIRRGYFEGRTTDQILRDLRGTKALQFNDGALALTNRSAQAVIKTTIQDAATKARMETLRENKVVTGVIWVSTLDDRTSAICQSLDGRRFPVDSGPRPPAHINCLPGYAPVTPCGSVSAVGKRRMKGHLVVAKTAGNRVLSCTPNHPVLTALGWKPAKFLNHGDKVVCDLSCQRPIPADGQVNDRVTTVEDVAGAFLAHRNVLPIPVPVAAPDFHGDGSDSDVAVIYADRSLLGRLKSSVLEHFHKNILKWRGVSFSARSRLRSFFSLGDGSLAAPGGLVGSRGQGLSTITVGHLHASELLLAPVAQFDTAFLEDSLYGSWRDAEHLADALNANAGGVFLDDVISVETVEFSDHVYNLETSTGLMLTDCIVTHNCRSTIVPEIDKAFAALERSMERASIDGPVPAKTTYFDWLKTQPAAFQDEAIGKTRGALLRDGGISAERFAELQLGKNFEPLTLDEMRKLEPVAFERAGL